MPTALTIGGSDSGGGGGVQADLKTFAAFGVYGTCAVTAIAAKNTVGVTAFEPLSADLVTAQMEAVASDIGVDAVKTGLLASAAIVEVVAAGIEALELPFVVVDPEIIARSGERVVPEDAEAALRAELLPRTYVVTPSLPEAERLAGMRIANLEDAREAARRIQTLGPSAVVIKGGHRAQAEVIDLLFDGRDFVELRSPRVDTQHTQGRGATFAAALAAGLALGRALRGAALEAEEYVAGAVRHGLDLGRGQGPLDHFWRSVR